MNELNRIAATSSTTCELAKDSKEEAHLPASLEQKVQTIATNILCKECGQQPGLKTCTRCKQVTYCGADCQKSAWFSHHKKICVAEDNPAKYPQQDAIGLTPLHYAAIYGREGDLPPDQLNKFNHVLDSFNGTPDDLKKYLLPPTDGVISLRKLSSEGEALPLTQEDFFKLAGVRFKEIYAATPDTLVHLHQNPRKDLLSDFIKHEDVRVSNFENAPPIVFLDEESGMGMGLRAGQDIKEGEIICCMGGELTVKSRNTYRASMYRVDDGGEQDLVSGTGIFINDGPPNAVFTKIKNYRGIPGYSVIVAIRDIKDGEFLHAPYGGDHSLRGGKYVIGAKAYQEVLDFCANVSFYRVGRSRNEKLNAYQRSMFRYIFGVSSLFLLLHLRGVLNVPKTKRLMQKSELCQEMTFHPPTFYRFYVQLLELIQRILASKDRKLVASIDQMSCAISESAFVQVLLEMNKDQSLASDSVPFYQSLGELIDHVYLFTNGTINGTYVGKEAGPNGEEMPDIPLVDDYVLSRYSTLPATLKTSFESRLTANINYLIGQGFLVKAMNMQDLFERLKDPDLSSIYRREDPKKEDDS